MRPILRPGLRRLRDSEGEAVLDHGGLRALDRAEVSLVDRLDGVRDATTVCAGLTDAEHCAAWDRLVADRVVVDLDVALDLLAQLPPSRRRDGGGEVASLLAAADRPADRLADRLLARLEARISVLGTDAVGCRLIDILAGALLAGARPVERLPAAQLGPEHLVVITDACEPAPEIIEPLSREDTPHLVAGLRGISGVVGPFVLPGASACTRCIDLTRASRDRGWLRRRMALSGRLGSAGPVPSPGAPLVPASTVVAELVAALAASEVLDWVEGRTPSTVDATVDVVLLTERLGPPQLPMRRQEWHRHAACGCGWAASATMEE